VSLLLNSLKRVLSNKEAEEDENFAEEENQRVYAKFLTPDGKVIPGITEHDSMGYRIESLKVYLELQLGEDLFLKIYKLLLEDAGKDEAAEEAQRLLGESKSKFLGLIIQLLFCEENYYK
jgi:NIMA (never in mitosis gene a)-related kinase